MADTDTNAAPPSGEAKQPARQSTQDRELKLQAENKQLKDALNEQRTTAERMQERASQASELERKVKAMQGEKAKLEKKLATAVERADQSEREAAHLRELLQSSATGTLKDLPKDAAQLKESVTLPGPDGGRVDANAGDVIVVGSKKAVGDLQESVGSAYRVLSVSKDAMREVRELGLLKE